MNIWVYKAKSLRTDEQTERTSGRITGDTPATRLPMQTVRRALVTVWVLDQILLVIVLGIPPLSSFDNLSDNLLPLGVKVEFLHLLGHRVGLRLLLGRVIENGGTVLGSRISSLPV